MSETPQPITTDPVVPNDPNPAPIDPALVVPEPEKMVAKKELDKVLEQMHKLKSSNRDLETQNKDRDLQSLKDKENWQKVAEIKEREASEARKELGDFKDAYKGDKKFSALRTAAMKAGIRDNALDDLELLAFDDVVLESTSTGKTNVLGVDTAIEALKTSKPHWFKSGNLNLPDGDPEVVVGGKITVQHVMDAENKFKKSGSKVDKQTYHALYERYRKQ